MNEKDMVCNRLVMTMDSVNHEHEPKLKKIFTDFVKKEIIHL